MSDKRIALGIITGAHGVRGQVKIRTFTETPDAIASYGPLSDKRSTRQWNIRIAGQWKDGVIAALDGITSRSAAEALKNTELFVDAAALPATEAQEHYISQFNGFRVLDAAGVEIGQVVGIYNFGAGDILEITFTDGATSMFPFARCFFPEIQENQGWLRLEKPEEV